jgi:ATP-binding cassette subfamily B protein
VVKKAIDTMGKGERGVGLLALLVAGLAVSQALARITSRILIFNAGRDAEYQLRRTLFAHLCRLDGAFYGRYRTGDLMSRLTNDLASVRALYGAGVLHGINTVFAYAIALPLMLQIDVTLTLAALAPYPVLLLGARHFARGIYQRSHALQRSLATMTADVQEDLAGIRELKTYRLEQRRSAAFGRSSAEYLKEGIRLAAWRAGMLPFVGLGAGASLVLVLWLGGQRVIEGPDLTLGDLVALNLYVGLLAWPTMAVGWMVSLWQRGAAAWSRLRELLEQRPELSADPADHHTAPPAMGLELRGLTVDFAGNPVLRGVDLLVAEGTLCGVVGKVGAGKSTLAQAVARLIDVPAGTVFFGGVDAADLSLGAVRARIAYAPQDAFLFSSSIRENIAYGLDDELAPAERDTRLADAVRAAGLEPDLGQLPEGLDTVVGERGIALSGGQRQRVALARALVAGSPLLILDDSLSSVDAETEREILANLRRVLRGTTALLISHRLSALQHADQVAVLDQGRVVEVGRHEELLGREGLYAQLYRRQLLDAEGSR